MDGERRHRLIEAYLASMSPFETAVLSVGEADLEERPGGGGWSPRKIIHHVADTEVIAGGRLRLLLARDGAPIVAYDQEALAAAADPQMRPVDESLRLIRTLHAANLALLEAMAASVCGHEGKHEDGGSYGLDGWVDRRAAHLREHADQFSRVLDRRIEPG